MTDHRDQGDGSVSPPADATDADVGGPADSDDRWSEEEVANIWRTAPVEHGQLAELYLKDRALDLSLISVDEMREAPFASKPGGKKFPALIFPGTNGDRAITRVQGVRFLAKPLKDKSDPRAVRLNKTPKITIGTGPDPVRFAALPNCQSSELLIADGPEDSMTLRQVLGNEAWASLGDGNIGNLPVRPGQRVVVFADRGSEEQAGKEARTLAKTGARVRLAPPPEGFKDVNEALQAGQINLIREAYAKARKIDPPPDLGIPSGFRLTAEGIERRVKTKEDREKWQGVCSWLRVVAMSRDSSGKGWGRLVEIRDADGNTHRWSMPCEMFAGDGTAYREVLLSLGLAIEDGREARRNLHDLLIGWQPPIRATTTDRLGWSDVRCATFVLPEKVIGGSGDEEVIFQSSREPANARYIESKGTLEDWKGNVACLCSGNPIVMFCVSAAFAAPLLAPMGLESGGIHLKGASSRGKTTAQRLAASVWGAPGYMQQWRATSNGLEGTATAHNSMLLVLDEIGQIDAHEAGQVAYMLANGSGKIRANTSGLARPVKRWALLFLSSGEDGIDDKIKETGRAAKAGQLVRVMDIPATDRAFGVFDDLHEFENGDEFARKATAMAANYYGVAGVEFVRRFLAAAGENTESARGVAERFRDMALDDLNVRDPDGQVQRALNRISAIAAGGVLATRLVLTGWQERDVIDACLTVFRLWLQNRGGTSSTEMAEALKRVRHFISSKGTGRFEDIDSESGQTRVIFNQAGWKYRIKGDEVYAISDGVWTGEVFTGCDACGAARLLRDAGYLISESGRLKRKVPGTAAGGQRCYTVRARILSDDGENEQTDSSIPAFPAPSSVAGNG